MEDEVLCEWAETLRNYLKELGLDAETIAADDLCEIDEDFESLLELIVGELQPALATKDHEGICRALARYGKRADHAVDHIISFLPMVDRIVDAIGEKYGGPDDE